MKCVLTIYIHMCIYLCMYTHTCYNSAMNESVYIYMYNIYIYIYTYHVISDIG